MFYVLLILLSITVIITILYSLFFTNKFKINNIKMFKNVGVSGIAHTDITLLFGIVCFKNDNNEENSIACYSYRDKIKKGERILITDYDSEKEMYIVDEYPCLKN